MSNTLNLQEIDQEQAFNLTKFFIHSQHNIFLFGKSGVGKTDIAIQAARECGYKINYINLSVVERADLAGYPDMNSPGDIVNYKSPKFLPKLIEGQKPSSVVLFDEVDKVLPEATAPLLEILLFKKINGIPLDIVSCILTGNLISERAYSNLISSALLERGAKYILSFQFDKWIDWAKSNGVHDLIIGFLRSNPSLACGDFSDTFHAAPSPRSWTLASQALLKTKDFKMVDTESVVQIISGYVGYEAGIKFKIWYDNYRHFEPYINSLIERGEMALNFDELHQTEKIVFVIAACYHAKLKVFNTKSKNKFVYLENLCKFFNYYKVDNEMQVMGLNNSFDFDLITFHKLYTCKPFFNLFTQLNEKIKA